MINKPKLAPSSGTDEVTVMVFKDNDASRSFQVSLGWITRLGFALGLLVSASLLASFFAFKFYRVARKADPSRVMDLENQIAELSTDKKNLEIKLAAAPQAAVQRSVNPMPVPTVTVTVTPIMAAAPVNPVTPAPAPVTSSTSTSSAAALLFSALPRTTQDLSASASKLPITVSPAHTSWYSSGRSLRVDFDIQYVGTDHGSEQGRIIVLARGPNSLFVYPEGALTGAGTESLIAPHQGEYFSVSRFREVKAEFPEIRATGAIHDIEVMIMNLDGQLLFYEKFAANEPPAQSRASAPRTAAPPSETSNTASDAEAASPKTAATAAVPAAKKTVTPKARAIPPKDDASELIDPGVDQ